jgi:beta-N-acetylhexosaminidase
VKHYPGHGDADKDSHLTLPQINLSLKEMENIHIKPFKEAVKNNIEMIMAAHLHCTCFDKEVKPASLSKNAISYLRSNLGYEGVIISDDMFMKGVQDYGSLEAVINGIEAGLDMFIFRESDMDTFRMIDKLVKIVEENDSLKNKVIDSNNRIEKLKSKYL